MAFPNVKMPSVWNIPAAAGVPALLGQSIGAGVDASASSALTGVAQNYITTQAATKWGIYQDTKDPLTGETGTENVLSAAHVHGIEYEKRAAISDAPRENGSFMSYNKVQSPYNARVTLICDGSETGSNELVNAFKDTVKGIPGAVGLSVRQSFLATLDRIVADTNLYSVVTPEKTYINANIVGYRWRRASESGLTMLVSEVELQEVRLTAASSYTNTRKPQGACVIQNGTVQTGTPSQDVINQVSSLPMFATGDAKT